MSLPRYADLQRVAPAAKVSDGVTALLLCAEWCGSCREFLPQVESLAQRMDTVRWAWIDVEDAADALPSLDVETFPTLAVLAAGELRFLGPVIPDLPTLTRLVTAMGRAEQALDGAEAEELKALAALTAALR